MIPIINKEEELNFTKLIRHNHFNLYEKLTKICSLKTIKNNQYSALMTDKMEWPNIIYNLNFNSKTADLLSELCTKIDTNKLPEFILIDSHAKPDDFDTQVRSHQILPVMRWPGMIFLHNQNTKDKIPPKEFIIRRVTNMEMLKDWISIANTNLFPKKGLNSNEFKALLTQENIQAFLGYFNDKSVSTLLINYHLTTSGLYIASTLPEYSGKGFMSSLINFSISKAKSEGYEYSVIEATPQSHHLYSSLEFQEVCNFDIYWKSQQSSI